MTPTTPAQHTPGPWTWMSDYARGDMIDGPDRMPVAAVAIDCRKPNVSAANARLIAQAPAMLEALRGLCDAIAAEAPKTPAGSPMFWQRVGHADARARAILRAVDGEVTTWN